MSDTVAVFGGSFDPPHIAHTLVASYVLSAHAIDRVLVIPCEHHPFNKRLAAFEHRLEMCKLAMADLRRVDVSDIARELGGSGRTLELLEALDAARPGTRWRLVIGTDLLNETSSWHRFDRIVELAPPLIVERGGHVRNDVDMPVMPEVSSTEVRARLAQQRTVEGLISPAVAAYAAKHKLYG